MIIAFASQGWEDYLYWHSVDKKTLKRINKLIKAISREPFAGLGDPEALKHDWSGCWSRRIDLTHRLVYKIENNHLYILQCRYHYHK